MNKNYLFAVAVVAAALTGCSQDELVDFNPEVKSGFTASLETVESRTTLDANNKVQWVVNEDHVSLFEKVDINAKYQVSSVDANGTAKLTYVSHIDNVDYQNLDQYYAVYPYDEANSIASDGTITAPVSATYTYKDKESCIASALMVARSNDKSLRFTNAQGIIRLKLNAVTPYKWGKIKSVTFTSTSNYLNGTATMSWDTETPVAKFESGEDINKTLTIELDESLMIDLPAKQDNKYAEYYVPIVPETYTTGTLKMTVTFKDGTTYTPEKVIPTFTVGRKEIVTLKHTIGSDDFSADIEDEVISDEVANETQLIKALQAGGKFTLVDNITLTKTVNIPEGVTVILNLNGKTLTGSILAPNANLTIENGTFNNANSAVSAIEINAGELTLDNVAIQSARHAVRIDGNVTATINGGTYQVGTYGGSSTNHAVNVSGNANVTINGGTFIGPKGTTADSGSAVNAQAGSTVTIKDGNFSGGKNNTLSAKGTLTVVGGTFDQDPSTYVADGYKVIENNDGTYTVGVTAEGVKEALTNGGTVTLIEDLTISGDNLTLAAGTKAVIDLGGNDLSVTGTDGKAAYLKVGGDLTITGEGNVAVSQINASDGSNLTIGEGVTITASGFSAINNNGTTVIDGATINHDNTAANGNAIQNINGTLIINNATVTSNSTKNVHTINNTNGTVTVNGGTFTHNGSMGNVIHQGYDGEIIINGGTFTQNGNDSLAKAEYGGKLTINAGEFKNNVGGVLGYVSSTSTATTNADGSITVTVNE